MKKKKTKRKISAPRPDKLPGEVKYRPAKGKRGGWSGSGRAARRKSPRRSGCFSTVLVSLVRE